MLLYNIVSGHLALLLLINNNNNNNNIGGNSNSHFVGIRVRKKTTVEQLVRIGYSYRDFIMHVTYYNVNMYISAVPVMNDIINLADPTQSNHQ